MKKTRTLSPVPHPRLDRPELGYLEARNLPGRCAVHPGPCPERRPAGPTVFNKAAILAIVVLTWVQLGCAMGRNIIDVSPPRSVDPSDGPTVTIANVADLREFSLDELNPMVPSVRLNNENLDEDVRVRVVGRKTNHEGVAMGDVALPDNTTVAGLVEAAVVRGFRESGYRVLADGEPGHTTATPLEVDVHAFWSWIDCGLWVCRVYVDARVQIRGDDGSKFNKTITAGKKSIVMPWGGSGYKRGLKNALDDITDQLRKYLLKEDRVSVKEQATAGPWCQGQEKVGHGVPVENG